MKPLNYAILKYFTTVKEASADNVIEALKGEYGKFKALEKKAVINALMTAEANGLIEETRFELDKDGELTVYYHAHEEGAATINKYIKD
jgi:DNA-binding PadR family transcriptional regulator